LDHVGARLEKVEDLTTHRVGVGHSERVRSPVVVVLGLLGHRERPRDGHLRLAARIRAQELHVTHLHGVAPSHGPHHPRHRIGMPAAIQGRARVFDIDALERGREAVGVALPTHLAVGDDVQTGTLLVGNREPRGVILGLLEIARSDTP
jgi:hypothetical protein